jgi:hypothetical protein
MEKVVTVLLVLVGIIHLLPISGVLGAERLGALYGVALDDVNLVILMRHRAVLFGLLGLFIIYAAFRPHLQVLALLAGLVSVVSFMAFAWSAGTYNDAIRKVFMVDIVALVALGIAATIYVLRRLQG